MRFLYSLIIGIGLSFLFTKVAPAYQVDPQLANDQVLESGGPSAAPSPEEINCMNNLRSHRTSCQSSPPQSALDQCGGNDQYSPYCAADECMKDLGYSNGINTPESMCVRRRSPPPPPKPAIANENSRRTEEVEEVVEEVPNVPIPSFKQPENVPAPTPAPREVAEPEPAAPRPAAPQPANVPAPTPRPGQPAPTSTAQWPQESATDIQQCSSYQSQANLCCNQPMNCSSELTESQQQSYLDMARAAQYRGDQAGIEEICRRSKNAGVSSSNLNTGFANICYSKHSMCTQTCSNALSKWQDRLNNCRANCDRSLVSQTVETLQGKQQQCRNYAALESRIRSQSFASAEDASLAQLCEQNSGSGLEPVNNGDSNTPGGWGDAVGGAANAAAAALPLLEQGPGEKNDPADQPQTEICRLYPNAPGCYDPAESQNGSSSGVSGVNAGTSPSAGDFNVGADNNFHENSGTEYQPTHSFQPQASQGHAIPNGGGGMPGSNGSASTASSGSGAELPAMLGSGVNPNILQEAQSGGGYSAPVYSNDGSGFEFRNRFGSIGKGGLPRGTGQQRNYRGLDLKKYLPGGASDPRRQLAGISDFHPDIGPKHIDFFQRVSTRLQTLCKLKRLLDCQ